MRWTPKEFVFEMEQDPERRVFVVEGIRDKAFWHVMGAQRSANTLIYPIAVFQSPKGEGGERGRLIRVARIFQDHAIGSRVRFFADANGDRLLGKAVPTNVMLTDGRDLESYGLSAECLDHICSTVFPDSGKIGDSLLELVGAVARPIGILRLASERNGLKLPFSRTVQGALKKFVASVDGGLQLDCARLIRNLLQNSGHGLSLQTQVREFYAAEVVAQKDINDIQLVHGKDLTELLGLTFDVTSAEMERHLFMSIAIESQRVADLAGIRVAREWLGR